MSGAGMRGVYNILATPFHADFSVDEGSLRRLVELTLAAGVDGVTVLGVAGEAQKLIAAERTQVMSAVIDAVAGRVPVVVGASLDGTEATIAAGLEAVEAGAAGLMIAPPTNLQPGPALTEHYRRVGEAVGVPIVLQDYPGVSGVTMTPRDMADLVTAVPQITTIKLEGVPTPQRTGRVLALLEPGPTVLGGLGGMYLLDELRRGASGTMTGFAYPEVLVHVWRHWVGGDRKAAAEVFYRYLPLLVFEGQAGIGLAIRKESMRRRGAIDLALVRQPGPTVDEAILDDLTELMTFLDMSMLGVQKQG